MFLVIRRLQTGIKRSKRSEKTLIQKHRNVTAGRVIAELNFGFWNSLYETHHYALLKGVPGTIFRSLPVGIGRKEINLRVQEIRNLRNRISHNEPLCFKDKTFDLTYVNEMYAMISDFLSWIAYKREDGVYVAPINLLKP